MPGERSTLVETREITFLSSWRGAAAPLEAALGPGGHEVAAAAAAGRRRQTQAAAAAAAAEAVVQRWGERAADGARHGGVGGGQEGGGGGVCVGQKHWFRKKKCYGSTKRQVEAAFIERLLIISNV